MMGAEMLQVNKSTDLGKEILQVYFQERKTDFHFYYRDQSKLTLTPRGGGIPSGRYYFHREQMAFLCRKRSTLSSRHTTQKKAVLS